MIDSFRHLEAIAQAKADHLTASCCDERVAAFLGSPDRAYGRPTRGGHCPRHVEIKAV